jgi:hypothetical protein
MRKFHSIAALCGDGLRPELQALFDRLAVDRHSELFVRSDGMVQSGPDPASEATKAVPTVPKKAAWSPLPFQGKAGKRILLHPADLFHRRDQAR